MKKVGKILALSILGLFLIFLAVSFISAADAKNAFKPLVDMFSGLIENIYSALKPALAILVGSSENAPEFMGKVLIAILIFSVTYAILSMTAIFGGKYKWALSLSSWVVALLGVRYLDSEWIKVAALPSGVYAVALTALVPFIAFGFVVMKFRSRTARKLSWILFGTAFLIFWLTRDELGTTASTIYPLAALICLLMVWFDGTIKHWQDKIAAEKAMSVKQYQQYIRYLKDRDQAYEDYIEAVKRFGANAPQTTTLKTQVDHLDAAIDGLMP